MTASPLKRAIRNSVILTFVVGIVVHLQGETVAASIMTMLFSFVFITPALWLSYSFTQKLANKHQHNTQTPNTSVETDNSADKN